MLADCWQDFATGRLVFHPQRAEGIVYARKIDKSESPIDWTADARSVRNQIHGLSPSPGAYSEIRIGGAVERIKFLRVEAVEAHGPPGQVLDDELTVACGDGAIRAREAQRAGKSPMSGAELMRGGNVEIGACFTPFAAPPSGR